MAALAALAASALPGDDAQRAAARFVTRAGDPPADAGAATLLVLARDTARDAASAREAAKIVVDAKPPSARALRAAGRIFHRLGEWGLAQRADEAALEVAGGVEAASLLESANWGDHPLPWLTTADVERGQSARAAQRITTTRERLDANRASLDPLVAWRLRAIVDLAWLRLWDSTQDWQAERPWPAPAATLLARVGVAPPQGAELGRRDRALELEVHAQRALAEGLIAARAAWPRGESDRLDRARAAAASLEQMAGAQPVPPRFELMRMQVLMSLAAALEARDELVLLAAQADSLEQRVAEAGVESSMLVSTPALLGELRLQLRDATEAAAAFEREERSHPGRAATARGRRRAAQMPR